MRKIILFYCTIKKRLIYAIFFHLLLMLIYQFFPNKSKVAATQKGDGRSGFHLAGFSVARRNYSNTIRKWAVNTANRQFNEFVKLIF